MEILHQTEESASKGIRAQIIDGFRIGLPWALVAPPTIGGLGIFAIGTIFPQSNAVGLGQELLLGGLVNAIIFEQGSKFKLAAKALADFRKSRYTTLL